MMIGTLKSICKKMLKALFGINTLYDHYFVSFSRKNPVIVDLGAGYGTFIEQLLGNIPIAECILIEADPFSIQKLSIKLGGRKNVKIVHAAIGPRSSDKVWFYLAKNHEFNSLYNSYSKLGGVRDGKGEVALRMITLRDVFQLFGLKEICLLKMDIEGAEWDILENLTQQDYQRIHQISVEFHDFLDLSQRAKTERCIRRLQDFGYEFICKGTNFMHGTPYYNCLFYNRKRLKWTMVLRWFKMQPDGSWICNLVKKIT